MILMASLKEKRPLARSAVYSPRLWPREQVWGDFHLFVQHRPRRVARKQYGRLGIVGLSKLLFGPVETKLGQVEIKSFIRCFEQFPNIFEPVVEFFAHTDVLRSLAGEDNGYLFHGHLFFDAASFISSRPMTFLCIWFVPS